jgi:hypothetical protein
MMGLLRASLVILSLAQGLVTVTASVTAAQNDSHEARDIAGRLFASQAVLFSHASVEASTSNLKPALEGQLGRQLSEEEARRLGEILARVALEALPRADIEAYYADLLVRHFSPEELTELAAFYRTPLGAKVLRFSSVTLFEEGAPGLERLLKAHDRELQERFRAEFTREFPAIKRELERQQRHTP